MIVRLSPAFCAYFNGKLLHRLKQFNIFVQERVPNVATVLQELQWHQVRRGNCANGNLLSVQIYLRRQKIRLLANTLWQLPECRQIPVQSCRSVFRLAHVSSNHFVQILPLPVIIGNLRTLISSLVPRPQPAHVRKRVWCRFHKFKSLGQRKY